MLFSMLYRSVTQCYPSGFGNPFTCRYEFLRSFPYRYNRFFPSILFYQPKPICPICSAQPCQAQPCQAQPCQAQPCQAQPCQAPPTPPAPRTTSTTTSTTSSTTPRTCTKDSTESDILEVLDYPVARFSDAEWISGMGNFKNFFICKH